MNSTRRIASFDHKTWRDELADTLSSPHEFSKDALQRLANYHCEAIAVWEKDKRSGDWNKIFTVQPEAAVDVGS